MKIAMTLAALVAAAMLGACGGGDTKHDVQYRIEGTRASLTYATASGGTSQTTVNLPYTVRLGEMNEGDFLYISAQNQYSTGGVYVAILVDGKVWKQTSSGGAYVIATASGSCC